MVDAHENSWLKLCVLCSSVRVVLPLCGGNIDTTVLGRCLDRGLACDGRLLKFSVTVSDRPGGIAELCRHMAAIGISIKDIMHERAWIQSDIFSVEVSENTRVYANLPLPYNSSPYQSTLHRSTQSQRITTNQPSQGTVTRWIIIFQGLPYVFIWHQWMAACQNTLNLSSINIYFNRVLCLHLLKILYIYTWLQCVIKSCYETEISITMLKRARP
jgi:hypothetical protein